MRRNYVPAEIYVDNVVRKLDFLKDHAGWTIECVRYRWIAEHDGQRLEDDDLGMLLDRIEHIAGMEEQE